MVLTPSNIHMAVVLAEVKGCKYAHEGKKKYCFFYLFILRLIVGAFTFHTSEDIFETQKVETT